MKLTPERFFDADPTVRQIALELYKEVAGLPLLSPHSHVEAQWFAENKSFDNPTDLIITPDHYIFRLLYSQGISLESLGIRPLDGSSYETDKRKIWRLFAENFFLFAGTPTGIWLQHEFSEVFGIDEPLTPKTADHIYNAITEKLSQDDFRPRRLYERFNLEYISTTDSASSDLSWHIAIRESGWQGKILPCFRPDAVLNLQNPNWRQEIDMLSEQAGIEVDSYERFILALEKQRAFFKSIGAVATDHGIEIPYTGRLADSDAQKLFARALAGKASADDARLFCGHMLMEMARMSCEDGLIMHIHPGALRNHNLPLFERFGPDKGADIPVQTEYTRNLRPLLNAFGNDPRFTLILFTLDETTYARELAPLAGHYPCLKIGPSWWFHDSPQGMQRFRERIWETASIYNTIGFIDDTRALPSIPARHDLARRIDCNFLAQQVARHFITMDDAQRMARDLSYNLTKKTYKV